MLIGNSLNLLRTRLLGRDNLRPTLLLWRDKSGMVAIKPPTLTL